MVELRSTEPWLVAAQTLHRITYNRLERSLVSQPLSLSAAATRASASGGVLNTVAGFYTGFTWPILLGYVGLGVAIMVVSLHGLLAGERALKLERKLFHGRTITPETIVEDGIDWLTRQFKPSHEEK